MWDPVSHLLDGLDMGWGSEPCCGHRALLKVGTCLMDITAVQELGEHWWWEQEEGGTAV